MSILQGLRPSVSARHAREIKALGGLARAGKFRLLIEREMNRADRIGMGCTLVVFGLQGNPWQQDATRSRLAWILRQRARVTDEIGLMEDGSLAALLPHTTPEGATRFAEDVCQSAEADIPRPRYVLHAYPFDGNGGDRHNPDRVAVMPLQALLVEPLPGWKRALDVVGASIGLVMASPIMAAAALATRVSSSGPAIYKQLRAGLGGRPFTIYKFRTMVLNAEASQEAYRRQSLQDGPAFKLRNDPRVTRLGRFLRKTSIDELPQLWNVLKGDMSLVGPRPMDCKEVAKCEAWHHHRHRVTPGLTCIWQVRGRSRVSFADWMRMDRRYLQVEGVLLDLWLLLLTLPAVVLRRGAY